MKNKNLKNNPLIPLSSLGKALKLRGKQKTELFDAIKQAIVKQGKVIYNSDKEQLVFLKDVRKLIKEDRRFIKSTQMAEKLQKSHTFPTCPTVQSCKDWINYRRETGKIASINVAKKDYYMLPVHVEEAAKKYPYKNPTQVAKLETIEVNNSVDNRIGRVKKNPPRAKGANSELFEEFEKRMNKRLEEHKASFKSLLIEVLQQKNNQQ